MSKKTEAPRKSSVVIQASGWQTTAARLSVALNASVSAIGPLEWEEKRMLILWLCDLFNIDPAKLVRS